MKNDPETNFRKANLEVKLDFINELGPMERDLILNHLFETLGAEDKKKLKLYVMPNYKTVKTEKRSLFPLYWNNALAAWKQMKVFQRKNREDEWFVSLPQLTTIKKPVWPLLSENDVRRKSWRLKYLLSVLCFTDKVTFF